MPDPLETLLGAGAVPGGPFPPSSRYAGLPLATIEVEPGPEVRYVTRRFLPDPDRFGLLRFHLVTEGERPDIVAALELGDAEAWWRVADANRVMRPEELAETIGRRLRITLPEGVPGGLDG
jgi:hypothetical protein